MNNHRVSLLAAALTVAFGMSSMFPSSGLTAPAVKAAGPVRFASFKVAKEEALRLSATEAAKVYSPQARPAIKQMIVEARKDFTGPGQGGAHKFEMDFAFVIGADGRIEQMLHEPDLPFARYVAAQVPQTRLPPPPKPGWVILVKFGLK